MMLCSGVFNGSMQIGIDVPAAASSPVASSLYNQVSTNYRRAFQRRVR